MAQLAGRKKKDKTQKDKNPWLTQSRKPKEKKKDDFEELSVALAELKKKLKNGLLNEKDYEEQCLNLLDQKFRKYITYKQLNHILFGDEIGGGHMAPAQEQAPAQGQEQMQKSIFPNEWNELQIIQNIVTVVMSPKIIIYDQDRYLHYGEVNGTFIKVISESINSEIITGYPVDKTQDKDLITIKNNLSIAEQDLIEELKRRISADNQAEVSARVKNLGDEFTSGLEDYDLVKALNAIENSRELGEKVVGKNKIGLNLLEPIIINPETGKPCYGKGSESNP